MNRRNDRAIQLAVLYGCDGLVTVVRDVWDDAAEGVERVVEPPAAAPLHDGDHWVWEVPVDIRVADHWVWEVPVGARTRRPAMR